MKLKVPCNKCQKKMIEAAKASDAINHYCIERNIMSIVIAEEGKILTWTFFAPMDAGMAKSMLDAAMKQVDSKEKPH